MSSSGFSSPIRVSFGTQLVAWLIGLSACVAGMINWIAGWDMGLATLQFFFLVIAPIIWMIERRRSVPAVVEMSSNAGEFRAWWLAISVGLTSWCTCAFVGQSMVDLPPAYHDEYSYVFEAKLLLSGQFSSPSHPTHSELFNQMHVLNEGRMASRYYPGTGLWLAPFLAWGHPYWGYWLASSLASVFVFWTGYELGRLRVAIFSGFACALSPGIALFSNLLLAHQPTLLGLSVFFWAFMKWQRTGLLRDALFAGCGLSFAMLCRPATAAGEGLPFGIVFFYWLATGREASAMATWSRRIRTLIAIGLPVILGWIVMLAYNQNVTGSWRTSPYQLYTDLYTPRHVYGFDNVIRGERKLGPKVIEAYDRWATNLTPELAALNVRDRLIASWLWTFDIVPFLLAFVVVAGTANRLDRRWLCVVFSILTLHAVHVPYWYAGIMGWHYVFESAPLWCLLLGLTTDLLFREWRTSGRWLMPGWWCLLLSISLAGLYFPAVSFDGHLSMIPRIASGITSIRYPRRQYAEFNRWLDTEITRHPAIVLIEIDPDDQHVDYVVNSPDLKSPVLRARFHPGVTDIQEIARTFPDRQVYLCHPSRKLIELVPRTISN